MTDFIPMHYHWDAQAGRYPPTGEPGIHLEQHMAHGAIVDCLLYRGPDGDLRGILNHFALGTLFQKPGSCNLWVHPEHQRQGIASALLRDAWHRWRLVYENQDWTREGDSWLSGLIERGKIDAAKTTSLNETFDWKSPPPGISVGPENPT